MPQQIVASKHERDKWLVSLVIHHWQKSITIDSASKCILLWTFGNNGKKGIAVELETYFFPLKLPRNDLIHDNWANISGGTKAGIQNHRYLWASDSGEFWNGTNVVCTPTEYKSELMLWSSKLSWTLVELAIFLDDRLLQNAPLWGPLTSSLRSLHKAHTHNT